MYTVMHHMTYLSADMFTLDDTVNLTCYVSLRRDLMLPDFAVQCPLKPHGTVVDDLITSRSRCIFLRP